MATHAPITGAPTRAPVISLSNHFSTPAPIVPPGPNSLAAAASTTRRSLLGALAIVPALAITSAAIASAPTSAVSADHRDPRWAQLVADYRAGLALLEEANAVDEEAYDAFDEALANLPPKPQSPGTGLPADLLPMTLAEIVAASRVPAYKAAWAAYERDLSAWTVERDALEERIHGPSRARQDANHAAYAHAFDALTKHRVATLDQLREKVEIIASNYGEFEIPVEHLEDIITDIRHLAAGGRS